jgi:hypothetical protein
MEAKNKTTVHKEDFFSLLTEESVYLLGYLEADGSFKIDKNTIRVYFQTTDKDIYFLEKLKEIVGFNGKLGISDNKANGKLYKKARFTVSSGVITVLEAGNYITQCTFQVNDEGTGAIAALIYRNSSEQIGTTGSALTNNYQEFDVYGFATCAANDTIHCELRQISGGSKNMNDFLLKVYKIVA